MSKRVQLTWVDDGGIQQCDVFTLPEGHEEVYIPVDNAPDQCATVDDILDELIKNGKERVLFLDERGLFGIHQSNIISIVHM